MTFAMKSSPFNLNPRHLRALSAIIARGSMSAAANLVGLSQPAMTQGIAKLEQRLGIRLFERHADGMTPTPAGIILAERTNAAIAHLASAVRVGRRGFAHPELLMTGTQLRAYLAVADAGGYQRAAERSGLSQPALHRAVREVEQLCSYALIERRGHGVGLTARGIRLARGVRLAGAELAAGIAEVMGESGDGGGSLTIGAMPLARAFVLPRAISWFTARYPRVRIEVIEGSWRELIDPLLDGMLDLTVGALREPAPAGVIQTPLLHESLSVLARAGHPLAGDAMPSLDTLAGFPWIVGLSGTPLRAQWEALFAGRERPAAPIECGSVLVVRQILRETDFLTLLSPDQVGLEIDSGVLGVVGPPLADSNRTIGTTMRDGWRPTHVQGRFIEFLLKAAETPKIE